MKKDKNLVENETNKNEEQKSIGLSLGLCLGLSIGIHNLVFLMVVF